MKCGQALLRALWDGVLSFAAVERPELALALLRVGSGSVLLAKCLLELPYWHDLYANSGLVPWAISEIQFSGWAPSLSGLWSLLRGSGVSPDQLVELVLASYLVSLLALIAGLCTRQAAGAAMGLHLTLLNSAAVTSYGVDAFATIALFYGFVFPVGAALSLDRLRRPRSYDPLALGLCVRTLQLHLRIVYLTSGIGKAQGIEWWSGDAIWRAVMQPQLASFDMSWMTSMPMVPRLLGWGTLLVETGYAFAVWSRLRAGWVLATVLLHLGIGVCLGLWLFSAIMIALTVAAFAYTAPSAALQWLLRRRIPAAAPRSVGVTAS